MENFEFKSQVATSVEQSRRLLELGLKKETADMMYIISAIDGLSEPLPYESSLDFMLHIPAWSLHRLMEIAMKGDKLGCITLIIHQNNVRTSYEFVITSIEHLIKIDEFKIDYLEEKK